MERTRTQPHPPSLLLPLPMSLLYTPSVDATGSDDHTRCRLGRAAHKPQKAETNEVYSRDTGRGNSMGGGADIAGGANSPAEQHKMCSFCAVNCEPLRFQKHHVARGGTDLRLDQARLERVPLALGLRAGRGVSD